MNQAVYAVIGIIAVAVAAAVVLSLNQENELPTPEVIQVPREETPTDTSEEWIEQMVTFRDSRGHIPEVMVSQKWANGDALHACSIMVDDPSVGQTVSEADLSWCKEFLAAYRNR